MTTALVLDLDDVLVSAEAHARSCFALVADHVAARHGWRAERLTAELMSAWRDGSGDECDVVDAYLARAGFGARERYPILHLVQCHASALELFEDADEFLERSPSRLRLGVLAAGHPMTQRNKVRALALVERVDAIVLEADGGEPWRRQPSLALLALCRALDASPADALYVGDHPDRDCAMAARLGMTAVRIRRGRFAREEYPYVACAGEIGKLTELLSGGYLRAAALPPAGRRF